MGDYRDYDFDDFYEPSLLEVLLLETEDKAVELIRSRVRKSMESVKESIQKRSSKLDDKENMLRAKESALRTREQDIEKQLKDIEGISLRNIIEERLHLDYFNFYTITWEHKDKPKCNKCDDNRELQSFRGDGTKHSTYRCKCHGTERFYVVNKIRETEVYVGSKRYFDKNQQENFYVRMQESNWDDSYSSLKVERINLLTTLEQAIANGSYYGIVLETKELAQQYCDYLNSKDDQ